MNLSLSSPCPRLLAAGFLLAGLLLIPSAHAQDTTQTPPADPVMEDDSMMGKEGNHEAQDLVSTLEARGNFTTLVGALETTGLAETLRQSEQPYTLFAPTDAAFAALPSGMLDSLSADRLAGLLRYHLVSGAAAAEEAVAAGTLSSVQGGELAVASTDAGVTVNGSAVTEADVEAGNSVIHVIGEVLMPKDRDASMSSDAMQTPEDDEAEGAHHDAEDNGAHDGADDDGAHDGAEDDTRP